MIPRRNKHIHIELPLLLTAALCLWMGGTRLVRGEDAPPATHTDTQTSPAPAAQQPAAAPTPAPAAQPPKQEPAPPPAVHAEMKAPTEAAQYIGAQTCLNCHTNRETFRHNLHAKSMPNAKGIDFEHTCETCHGPGSLHAAAAGDRNNPGFSTVHNPAKMKPAEVSAICLQCHEGGNRMHWQGSMHEKRGVGCTSCHSMHNEAANDGRSPLLKKTAVVEVCAQCHSDKISQIRKSSHMPLLEDKMSCANCHNPHGGPGERNLVKASVTETCYQCHTEKRGPFLWEHPPVREDCRNCHNPHGSHNESMLVLKLPLLCQRCHQGTRHPPTVYDATTVDKFNNRAFNRACVQCHSQIHGSNHPSGKRFHR